MGDIVCQRENQKSWIRYIRKRIAQNKNFLGFVGGATGSGKSWSCLRIAEELDSRFSIDQVVFTGLELMDLINSDKLRRGSVIVFEEAGIEMSSKNWQSTLNKMLNFLIQTFRHRNFILLFNSPYLDFVDASTRRLFHAEIKTRGIDEKEGMVLLDPILLQYNAQKRKFYNHRLKVITDEGIFPLEIWKVEKPSEQLIEDYEKKKRAFTDALNKRIYAQLKKISEKELNKPRPLTDTQQEVLDHLKSGKNNAEIAKIRGVSIVSIEGAIGGLKKKGYKIMFDRTPGINRYKIEEPELIIEA